MAKISKNNLYDRFKIKAISRKDFNSIFSLSVKRIREIKSIDIQVTEDNATNIIVFDSIAVTILDDIPFAYRRSIVSSCEAPDYFKFYIATKDWQVINRSIMSKAKLIFKDVAQEVIGVKVWWNIANELKKHEKILPGEWDNDSLRKEDLKFAKLLRILSSYFPGTKGKVSVVHRTCGKRIWDACDKEALDITIRLFGFSANSTHYNVILANKEEAIKIFKSTPAVLLIAVLQKIRQISKVRESYQCCDALKGITQSDEMLRLTSITDIVQEAKATLKEGGINNKRYWNYITKLPANRAKAISMLLPHTNDTDIRETGEDDQFEFREHIGGQGNTFAFVLTLLILIQDPPTFTTFKKFIKYTRVYEFNRIPISHPDTIALFRAAFRESHNKRKDFWETEVELIIDWFKDFKERNLNFDRNQRSAPWTWFVLQQENWHRDVLARKEKDMKESHWESLLDGCTLKDFEIIPLITAMELYYEGKNMKHCVASYYKECMRNKSRIFSLKKDDKRIATLELRPDLAALSPAGKSDILNITCEWRVGQLRGPCNKVVSGGVKDLAKMVCEKYNLLQRKTES